MDALSALLAGPRAQQAFLLRAVMDAPWCVRVEDRAPLSVVAIAGGEAWVVPAGGDATRMSDGDVAIMRGPEPYVFADRPSTPPQIVCLPGQRCTTPLGEDLSERLRQGVRTWGNAADADAAATTMLIGTYEYVGESGRELLAALPPALVVSASEWASPVAGLLAEEIVKDRPGQDVVLDRLLDLLVVTVVRAWFERAEVHAPAWYRAQSDPVVGDALRMLQNNPEHPWTIAALASETGVSRATMARRFNELLGEPPMAFLTRWRLALAADLLLEPGTTIGAVAQRVGYGSAFALSTAFKRARGVSPREHRALAATVT